MCHCNEEWWKIWRGIDLSLPKLHDKFDKSWPEHSKILKIALLTEVYSVCPKKKYRGVMFDDTEYWCKIWMKIDLCL